MRAHSAAPLTESDLDAIAAKLFEKLCERGSTGTTSRADPNALIDWDGVRFEAMLLRGPDAKSVCRQTVWRWVAQGKIPEPCFRPNKRVARWRRGDIVDALRKFKG